MAGKLSLYDFRDLDLLLKIAEEGDNDGGVTTAEIAEALGTKDIHNVSSRFAWMKRYGMLERDEKTGAWYMTQGAKRVMAARIKAAASRQLETLPDETMVDVMSHVTLRWRLGDPMIAQMLRREFLFGTQKR